MSDRVSSDGTGTPDNASTSGGTSPASASPAPVGPASAGPAPVGPASVGPASASTAPASPASAGPSRRAILTGALGVLVGAGAGIAAGRTTARSAPSALPSTTAPTAAPPTAAPPSVTPPAAVDPAGATQAGIERPATPQRSGLIAVLDLADPASLTWLGAVGSQILELTAPGSVSDALPEGPGDLAVSVGLGPRVVAAVSPDLPGAQDLPDFAGDQTIDDLHRGGDVLISVYASDPGVLTGVLRAVTAVVPGTVRWSQRLFRGPGTGTAVRNPIGFRDGIIVPRGESELAENVWLDATDSPAGTDLTGATICVVRRLRLAADDFEAQPVPEQERIIGRRRADGAPLTSTGPDDEVDLLAKSPEGEFITPARSHARAAHPSFTGSGLMLRRGYAYDNGNGDAGLAFICFQRELRTFVATQHRLDEVDDLMAFTTATASCTFLMLPGFSADRPLGAALTS